jgi:predicted HTH transcriptional regulator
VERKSRSDRRAWLQTAVAFANSAPIDWPAILFVGVDNSGAPQLAGTQEDLAKKLEDLAKSVSDVLDQAYPAIYRHIVPLHLPDGGCLAVIIPGSEARPHFAGKSYIRDGPQTKEASEGQLAKLIAGRNSKTYEILKWKGRTVELEQQTGVAGSVSASYSPINIVGCNQFFFTYNSGGVLLSMPLGEVDVSFNNQTGMLRLVRRLWK